MVFVNLACAVQNYDWGIKGRSEGSARGALNTGVPSDAAKRDAELWLGTHPSGPSVVKATGEGLREMIARDAKAHLGDVAHARFGDDLPFLTKVLSVAKALSIQAHPDKTLAQRLHADRPHVYKDANHKPEMTLAVTEFEALCAFVAPEVLSANLRRVPELRAVVGERAAVALDAALAAAEGVVSPDGVKKALRDVFTALMSADAEQTVTPNVRALVKRLDGESGGSASDSASDRLAVRLDSQYPSDVGVLCAYVLNYVRLAPGECIYLAANEPHAYLSGECVECMATSDNVVRAGLTPKLRDVDVLCGMLTYQAGDPVILKGEAADARTKTYAPPFDEFMLERIELPAGETYELRKTQGPCVILAVEGEAKAGEVDLARGAVAYASAGEPVVVDAGAQGCALYRAMINDRVFQ